MLSIIFFIFARVFYICILYKEMNKNTIIGTILLLALFMGMTWWNGKTGGHYGIAGTTQNPVDYEIVKNLPYYVGSIGTSIDEERRAAKEMTEYYLQCMIHRAKGDLVEWQMDYKGLNKEAGE